MNKRGIALLAGLFLLPGALTAQTEGSDTAYVTDVLRLGLYQQEDTSGSPFRTLLSGTRVAVLDRRTFYARVRTPDGEEGWVKSNFLQEQKPAALRAAEYEAENKQMTTDLTRIQGELDRANGAVASIKTQVADATGLQQETESLRRDNRELRRSLDAFTRSLPLKWSLILAGILAVLGFVGGIAFLDYRIRKRHGGFRIY